MKDKIIVLTMYGKDENVESISISSFDREIEYYAGGSYSEPLDPKNSVLNYCSNINELELKDNHWISAQIIHENQKISLKKPSKFDIINKMHHHSLYRVISAVDKPDLAKALKDIDEETKEKVFKSMSPRAALMLKEDIDALHDVSLTDIKSARNKILEAIKLLTASGEILLEF